MFWATSAITRSVVEERVMTEDLESTIKPYIVQ